MKILIVESFDKIRNILTRILRDMGFSTVEAENGKGALEVLKNIKDIGLILSGWKLSDMDGVDFLKEIRSNSVACLTPCILLANEATKEAIENAVNEGATDFIVKPFTMAIFRNKIKKALSDD